MDSNPNKDTHKALADCFKLTETLRFGSFVKEQDTAQAVVQGLQNAAEVQVYKSCDNHVITVSPDCWPQLPLQSTQNVVQVPSRWTTRQNLEEFSQNTKPRLPETFEALRRWHVTGFLILAGRAHLDSLSAAI